VDIACHHQAFGVRIERRGDEDVPVGPRISHATTQEGRVSGVPSAVGCHNGERENLGADNFTGRAHVALLLPVGRGSIGVQNAVEAPADTLALVAGCVVNTSCVAVPGLLVRLKLAEVAPVADALTV